MTSRPDYEQAVVLLGKYRSLCDKQKLVIEEAKQIIGMLAGEDSVALLEFCEIADSMKTQLDIC